MADLTRMARRIMTECPGFRLRQASRVVTKMYDDALRPLRLQSSQLPILVALTMFGESGATMKALADAIVMDPTTLTRAVRPLEKEGLVRVARSPDDARTRVVLLTRAGERALASAFPRWERTLSQVRAVVGEGAVADLLAGLDQVIATRSSRCGRRLSRR
jgi:DNA-binding MarR family transcriptional regulator